MRGFIIAKKPALFVHHQDGLIFCFGNKEFLHFIKEGMESEATKSASVSLCTVLSLMEAKLCSLQYCSGRNNCSSSFYLQYWSGRNNYRSSLSLQHWSRRSSCSFSLSLSLCNTGAVVIAIAVSLSLSLSLSPQYVKGRSNCSCSLLRPASDSSKAKQTDITKPSK